MNLPDFFTALDGYKDLVPIETLVDLLRELDVTRADVEDVIAFGDEHYHRNLLRVGTGYAALVLCWRAGQRETAIHNHAGSACGVRVIDGIASETRFDRDDDGMLHAVKTNLYPTGYVCGSWDADIHEMFNEHPRSHDLVTLHVYTPPLRDIQTYSLDSPEIGVWSDVETLAAMNVLREQTARA